MIFLGLGTNLGDKKGNLKEALQRLEEAGVEIIRISSYYHTPPWGILEQDTFLNMVAEVRFPGTAAALLEKVLLTEIQMGRVRQQKWGPRLIDIDILEFDRMRINEEELILPHPYYPERVFVLAPFAELEPDWVPTGHDKTVSELLAERGTEGLEKLPKG